MASMRLVLLVVVGALAGTHAQKCETVADLLVEGNYTILIQALKGAQQWALVQDPEFAGTVLAPTDDAFGLALSMLGSSPESLVAASGDQLTALQGILTAHVLTIVLPELKTGTYATLQPATKAKLDASTFDASAVAADGSPGLDLTTLGIPPSSIGDEMGEPSCNHAAYVYPLEGFPLVPPSILTSLLSLG